MSIRSNLCITAKTLVFIAMTGVTSSLLAIDSQELTQILGSTNTSVWKLTDQQGKPVAGSIQKIDGKPTLFAETGELRMLSTVKYLPDTEIIIRFAMAPGTGTNAFLRADIAEPGCKGPQVIVETTGGSDTLKFNAAGIRGDHKVKCDWKMSLGWPEDFRKIVEREMALQPGLSQRWLSLRYVLKSNSYRIYINDMLAAAKDKSDIEPDGAGAEKKEKTAVEFTIGGPLSLAISPGVYITSIRSRFLTADNPVFEPVRIDSRLNARKISGHTVADNTFPASGRLTMENIPFIFPEKDRQGNDHIDVGTSWLQSGCLEGEGPDRGPFGGRWSGPFNENPARIQFSVPKGRYKALHLIAAADLSTIAQRATVEDKSLSVPVVTVQFYRRNAGRPESFSTRVPFLTAKSTTAMPLSAKLDNGRPVKLYLLTIPIDPGALDTFDDLDACYMEITKGVQLYREYPDPGDYSAHTAGLPSSVHIYAMTLERPAVLLNLSPDAYAHIWTAPETPSYTVRLKNITGAPKKVSLEFATTSYDGTKGTSEKKTVTVLPGGETTNKFTVKPEKYGYHDVKLTMDDGETKWVEKKNFAYLHEDTRERGDWQPGKGPIFGFWNGAGGHVTPPSDRQYYVMALIGAEAAGRHDRFIDLDDASRKVMEQFKMVTFLAHPNGNEKFAKELTTRPPEEVIPEFIKDLKEKEFTNTPYARFELLYYFGEPNFGTISCVVPPDYYGEKYEFTKSEEERYQYFERTFILMAGAVRKNFPQLKNLMPWGDPLFPVYFLRRSQKVRELIDGVAVDIACFERLPEMQIHQVAIHRLWVMNEEFKKAGITNPILYMIEGPALSTRPGALSLKEQADNLVRYSLLLYGYGINPQCGGWGWETASYWGEQHYGGGIMDQIPIMTPKPVYAALATLTRHLNRKNYKGWLPTGSHSVYALQFEHYKTGERTYVFWTIRGKRPVTLEVPAGTTVRLFDQMDNEMVLEAKDGKITFMISPSPCFVEGITAKDFRITLGESDHSDSLPATTDRQKVETTQKWHLTTHPDRTATEHQPVYAEKIANPGDGTWKISDAPDKIYENNHPLHVARFPGKMTVQVVTAPEQQGGPAGRALAVHMGPQEKERNVMPYYTSIVPSKPVTIPGKASHIGVWVKGASDWGRVVYFLRDSKGEQWISIGKTGEWNNDDIRSWSSFNFDGWRYLRFELPSNSPYDTYRENGTTWWGYYPPGDGIVDLPLRLEKIVVERRTKVIYVNSLEPANSEDVLLAEVYAEYMDPEDATQRAVELSRARMPVPKGIPDLGNPIKEMEAGGVGEPVKELKIGIPEQCADGQRCYVHFRPVEAAAGYDVWVSSYPDGTGALKLGSDWKKPGEMITGLRPDTDFYVFVVYTDRNGKKSKPSKPLKIRLQAIFGFK